MRSDRSGGSALRAGTTGPLGEGGFALAMVILLLFTVAVAGATGYQLVSAESELASGSESQEEALAVARAGIERYVGEHIGQPGAPTTYAVGDGSVRVTQKKIARLNGDTDVYLLQAVGTVADPRYPASPATRTVRQYAHLHTMPVNPVATLIATNNNVDVTNGNSWFRTRVLGTDLSSAGACTNGGGAGVLGIAGAYPPTIEGGAYVQVTGGTSDLGDVPAVIDSLRARWDALKDPTFSIPFYDGVWPNFFALPSDSFPVIRVNGNFAGGVFTSGRGALIVTGTLTILPAFTWNGIILAGQATDLVADDPFGAIINGVIAVGLNGGAPSDVEVKYTRMQYHECYVREANRALAHFELVDGARWEF